MRFLSPIQMQTSARLAWRKLLTLTVPHPFSHTGRGSFSAAIAVDIDVVGDDATRVLRTGASFTRNRAEGGARTPSILAGTARWPQAVAGGARGSRPAGSLASGRSGRRAEGDAPIGPTLGGLRCQAALPWRSTPRRCRYRRRACRADA